MNCGLRIVVFLCIYLVPNVMSMGDAYACLLEQLAELITTHQNVVSVRRWVWPPQTSPERGKQPCFLFISKRSGTINFGQIPITSKKYWEFSGNTYSHAHTSHNFMKNKLNRHTSSQSSLSSPTLLEESKVTTAIRHKYDSIFEGHVSGGINRLV